MADTMSGQTFPMSYTAPQFTENELRQEMTMPSKEEAYDLECERRGIHPLRRETPEMRDKLLREFEAALANIADKDDYVRASEVAPAVVQRESSPLFFLRCEDYDAKAAAARITAYWKTRCEVFGERALLPLTQSGDDGALTAEDLADLNGGSLQLLEPDDTGRSVIYFNRAALTGVDMRRPVLLRNLLYLYALICKDPVRQRHGYVFIVDTMGFTIENNYRKASKKLIDTLKYVAPVRLGCIHLCYPEVKCVARFFLPPILWLMGRKLRERSCIHSGAPKELLFDLSLYGMSPLALPNGMGGSFSLGSWQEAVRQHRTPQVEPQSV